MQTKRKRYLRDGKPIHRPELRNDIDYEIMVRYQGEYRGLVHYYGLAQNLAQLGALRGTMAISLLKTLAGKHQTSVRKEAKRLQGTAQTPEGPRTCLKLTIPREGKEHIEMHHIRTLADLNKEGRREKPLWMKIMISRKRKSMPLCRRCHDDIHANRPKSTRQGNRRAG